MAKLKDKCNLFQWDINQKLTGLTCKYVDFVVDKNGTKEVYRVEVVNGVCPIPDEFFQRAGKKIIYEAYEDGTYKEVILTVNPRPVPPDYAYTPTEQMTFDGLVLKVNTLVESVTQMVERGDFNGEDGFSPIIKVEEVTGGYRITIINKDGPSVFYVKNGHDGFDGFSPIAKVERIATGAIITITDKSGTTTAVINDGQGSGGGGNVDDVLVNGVSVVTNKVANINVPPPYDDTEIKNEVDSLKQNLNKLPSDVQINGTSIIDADKVANIPVPNNNKNTFGVVSVNSDSGLYSQNGYLTVDPASTDGLNNLRNNYSYRRPIVPYNLDLAIRLAMCDGKGAAWTEEEKANARARMGISEGVTGDEYKIDSSEPYIIGKMGTKNLYRKFLTGVAGSTLEVSAAIPSGATPIKITGYIYTEIDGGRTVMLGTNLDDYWRFTQGLVTSDGSISAFYVGQHLIGRNYFLWIDYAV